MLVESAIDVFDRLKGEPVILSFSGGKDSIVMLDIAMRHHVKLLTVVYGQFAERIPSRESLLKHYEQRYGVQIHRRISWYGESARTGKPVRQRDTYAQWRREFNVSWIAEGIKPTDSIVRNALLKKADKGINVKMLSAYPLYRWYDRAVMAYIRQNKLILPPEYQSNVKHDLSNMTVESLIWTKHNLPADYECVVTQYPWMLDRIAHRELYAS